MQVYYAKMKWFKRPPPQGYDDEAVADLVVRKTKAIDPAVRLDEVVPADYLLPSLMAVACAGDRVLDFGGGAGLHYLAASRAFPRRKFRWAIVEHPLMIRRASDMQRENMKFFPSPEQASEWLGEVDLLHSNGVLQYLDEPEAMLLRLLAIQPAWISWSRLLIGPEKIVETQVAPLSAHGGGPLPSDFVDREITHKTTVMNQTAFLAAHSDYRTVWRSADSMLLERSSV